MKKVISVVLIAVIIIGFTKGNYAFADTKPIVFPTSTSMSQSQTINIPQLISVDGISVDTGTVSYTKNGDNVTINVTNGSPVNAYKFVTGQTSSYYNDGTFSGSLSSYVAGGTYVPGDSMPYTYGGTAGGVYPYTGPTSFTISSGGYTGTIYVSVTPISITTNPDGTQNATYSVYGSGTLYKPPVDNRVWRYQGNVYVGGCPQYAYNVSLEYTAFPSKSVNFNDTTNLSINPDTKNYFIYISDGQGCNGADGYGGYFGGANLSTQYVNYLKSNNFCSYIVAPTAAYDYKMPTTLQSATLKDIVNSTGGAYCDKGDLQKALDDINNKLANDPVQPDQDAYVLLNEDQIKFKPYYYDTENDPIKQEYWRFTQDPNYFDNPLGLEYFESQWINSQVNTFDKTGKFMVEYEAADKPSDDPNVKFNEDYSKRSNDVGYAVFYVHRRPIANFKYNLSGLNLTLINTSYDLDHSVTEASTSKGITASNWKWKTTDSMMWNTGQPPTPLINGKTYIVELMVQDEEGAWSYPVQKIIGAAINNPPTALFTIEKPIMYVNEVNHITNLSYDIDDDPIAQEKWEILNSSGNVLKTMTIMPDLSKELTVPGTYSIRLTVQDNPKIGSPLWSAPYTQSVKVYVGNLPPIADFEINNMAYTDSAFTFIDNSYDPDGDPIVKREYAIKYGADTTSEPSKKNGWKMLSKMPKSLGEAGFMYDGYYSVAEKVTDDPTGRNQYLKPLESDWKIKVYYVDIYLQLAAQTKKVISSTKSNVIIQPTTQFRAGNGVIVVANTEGHAYKVTAALSLSPTKTATLVTNTKQNIPEELDINNWHTRYTYEEGYEKNMIIPLRQRNGAYNVLVKAYRRRADGSDLVVEQVLPITVDSTIEFKTEIIKE